MLFDRPAPGPADRVAVDLGRYIDAFLDAEAAQRMLLATYGGKPIDAREAAVRLGYRPDVMTRLPQGWSLQAAYRLSMPCCECVQWCLDGRDGRRMVIFEHEAVQPVVFGSGQTRTVECNGRVCQVVAAKGMVVATWEAVGRRVTVVGARDMREVAQLMAHLDGHRVTKGSPGSGQAGGGGVSGRGPQQYAQEGKLPGSGSPIQVGDIW
ncbi:MAG TPA: hypothetical protein EYP56_17315 [Planctomycetaceae bacterium]|nr:hypothetical protein [Planctomycetaceae bacterium]